MEKRLSSLRRSGWLEAVPWVLSGLVALAMALGLAGTARATDVEVNIYGDSNYTVEKTEQTSNAFSTPRLELFLTGGRDKLAFLAETMFEVGDDNEFGVDIERVEIAYVVSDALRLRVGRFHTAIGYYNDAYHHGRYFQVTVDRPAMVRFEDEGGLIAAHSVGVHADGRFQLGGAAALRYDLDVANGRGHTPAEVTNLTDADRGKMVNLRLRIEPTFLDGLIIGGNVLVDSTNAFDPADPTMMATIFVREIMFGGHIAYREQNVHVIGEYLHVSHRASGATHATQGAFLELGYTFAARLTPYVRGEWLKFPAPGVIDPFYAQNAIFAQRGSFTSGLGGLRILASDYIALKIEGEYVKRDARVADRIGSVQCAFAF